MKPPHVDHMFALNRGKSRSLHMFRRDAKQGSTLAGKGAGRLVAALVRLDVVVPRISSVTWVFLPARLRRHHWQRMIDWWFINGWFIIVGYTPSLTRKPKPQVFGRWCAEPDHRHVGVWLPRTHLWTVKVWPETGRPLWRFNPGIEWYCDILCIIFTHNYPGRQCWSLPPRRTMLMFGLVKHRHSQCWCLTPVKKSMDLGSAMKCKIIIIIITIIIIIYVYMYIYIYRESFVWPALLWGYHTSEGSAQIVTLAHNGCFICGI